MTIGLALMLLVFGAAGGWALWGLMQDVKQELDATKNYEPRTTRNALVPPRPRKEDLGDPHVTLHFEQHDFHLEAIAYTQSGRRLLREIENPVNADELLLTLEDLIAEAEGQ